MKKLYIIGAGGFGREVYWLTQRINQVAPAWDVAGFIDDDKAMHGKMFYDRQVLGGCEYFETVKEEVWVVAAVGASKIRKKVVEKLSKYGNLRFATLIDPSVIMSEDLKIGQGSVICAGAVISVNVTLGDHVIVNWNCTVGHDSVLEDYVILYPAANVSGCVRVGGETELGTGMQVIQGKTIGRQCVIGAGAVVVRDLPDGCTAVGVPARPIISG